MTRPAVIAVSQRVDHYPDRNERRDALDQALVQWIENVGGVAVPVPNILSPNGLATFLDRLDPDGVVLSGGNDIGAEPARDETEAGLIDWADRRNRPLLGICRGMQMIAVAAGGTLKQVAGHVRTRHDLGPPFGDVNSYHDLAIGNLPDGFEILARSADSEIEAFRHRTRTLAGWMWHPERERPFDPGHVAMAREFFRIDPV